MLSTLMPLFMAAAGLFLWALVGLGALLVARVADEGRRGRWVLVYAVSVALGLAIAWYLPWGVGRVLYSFPMLVAGALLVQATLPLALVLVPGFAIVWALQAWIARELPCPRTGRAALRLGPRELAGVWTGISLALFLVLWLVVLTPAEYDLFGVEGVEPALLEGSPGVRVLLAAAAGCAALVPVTIGHVAGRLALRWALPGSRAAGRP